MPLHTFLHTHPQLLPTNLRIDLRQKWAELTLTKHFYELRSRWNNRSTYAQVIKIEPHVHLSPPAVKLGANDKLCATMPTWNRLHALRASAWEQVRKTPSYFKFKSTWAYFNRKPSVPWSCECLSAAQLSLQIKNSTCIKALCDLR